LVKCPVQREWYARQTIEYGWSRSVLVHQIENRLFDRQGGALTNFERTLPAEQRTHRAGSCSDPRVRQGLRVRRQPVSAQRRRAGFLSGLALLSPASQVFRRLRAEGRGIQAGIRRQDELLSFGDRRPASPSRRQSFDWNHSLQSTHYATAV